MFATATQCVYISIITGPNAGVPAKTRIIPRIKFLVKYKFLQNNVSFVVAEVVGVFFDGAEIQIPFQDNVERQKPSIRADSMERFSPRVTLV